MLLRADHLARGEHAYWSEEESSNRMPVTGAFVSCHPVIYSCDFKSDLHTV